MVTRHRDHVIRDVNVESLCGSPETKIERQLNFNKFVLKKQCQASSWKSDTHSNHSHPDSHFAGKWSPQGCLSHSVLKDGEVGVAWTLKQAGFGEKGRPVARSAPQPAVQAESPCCPQGTG